MQHVEYLLVFPKTQRSIDALNAATERGRFLRPSFLFLRNHCLNVCLEIIFYADYVVVGIAQK